MSIWGPQIFGFESYAFSARPNVEVVELVGAIKAALRARGREYVTVNQSSARKLLLGKVPRKGAEAKAAAWRAFQAASGGLPPGISEDETDALCILNFMMQERGGFAYAQS
jgi:hypothetical protein